ncbi:MAG: hypothetical protein HY689_10375 [Chloroflexi bacterium]|nr:hypothetical protein [Chloroflexota bacterium]
MGLNIFFDVDYTLIGYDGSLRPHVREVFEQIKADGHTIYIWSGMGVRWEVVDRHGLRPYVSGCYTKPLADHHHWLGRLGVPVTPDFCVDDHQEIIDAFGGVRIRPYEFPDRYDREMQRVYHIITTLTAQATPGE